MSIEHQSISTEDESQEFDAREEPDGEETTSRNAQPNVQTTIISPGSASGVTSDAVKVPNWILSDNTLEVVFNERATQQIDEFQINRVIMPSKYHSQIQNIRHLIGKFVSHNLRQISLMC